MMAVVMVILMLRYNFSRSLASNLCWLNWNEHLILDRLGLVNDLWYQMDDIAALIGVLTHHCRCSSCHQKIWLLLLLFSFVYLEV